MKEGDLFCCVISPCLVLMKMMQANFQPDLPSWTKILAKGLVLLCSRCECVYVCVSECMSVCMCVSA